jgi:hypothetical protein
MYCILRTMQNILEFQAVSAVVMNRSVFWDTTPCGSLKVYRRFGETFRLYLQSRRISLVRNQSESRWQISAFKLDFCLTYSSTLNMETDIFLRNVGGLSTDYTALYPRE